MLAAGTVYAFNESVRTKPELVFDFQTDTAGIVQVFFDIGKGITELGSSRFHTPRSKQWREIRMELKTGRLRALRLDPLHTGGNFALKNIRIVGADRVEIPIPLSAIRAVNHILAIEEHDGQLDIQSTEGAYDPILAIELNEELSLPSGGIWLFAPSVIRWTVVWSAILLAAYHALRLLVRTPLWNWLRQRPKTLVWAAAIFGAALAFTPVIFMGKSLLAPGNGVPLFYDSCPTVPDDSDCAVENVRGADIGAMAWSHFPLTVAQERAIKKFGEFPLWNRYNSAGVTMIGQGQLMLGDPFNWLMWLVGVEAVTFDIKFLLLRIVFAVSLGLAVLSVTRSTGASVLVAFAAPFISYFIYRVNHPAIFTLCYAPLISLAWLKLIYADKDSVRLHWVIGLMLANWLVLNSGTAKEAYMAIIALNAIGAVHFVVERSRLESRFMAWAGVLVASGIFFMLIAAPVWVVLLDTLQTSYSGYQSPGVQQLPPWYFLGFVDNYFYLLRFGQYFPAVNALLFVGCVVAIVCTTRMKLSAMRHSTLVLAIGCAGLIAIAFGIVPADLLLAIPFVNNVHHVHNTFSTVLIVPASILAGFGFAHMIAQTDRHESRQSTIIIGLLLLLLIALYLLSFAKAGGLKVDRFSIYSIVILGAAMLMPWLIFRLLNARPSYTVFSVGVLVLVLLLGRGAMYPHTRIEPLVLNPQQRLSLTMQPEIIDRLKHQTAIEPARVIGLGAVLFSGYNATYGLEHVNGVDALQDRRYRELNTALKMPYTSWGWRMNFDRDGVARNEKALDFLGDGFVFSSEKIDDLPGVRYVGEDGRVYLYSRDGAWPRAFYTNRIDVYDDIPALAEKVLKGDGRPFVGVARRDLAAHPALRRLVEQPAAGSDMIVKASDYRLTNNSTSFKIEVPAAGAVYLGEAGAPRDFIVEVNGKRVLHVMANHAFKAVIVEEPGIYQISFRYWPAHLTWYLMAAFLGLVLWLITLLVFWKRHVDDSGS